MDIRLLTRTILHMDLPQGHHPRVRINIYPLEAMVMPPHRPHHPHHMFTHHKNSMDRICNLAILRRHPMHRIMCTIRPLICPRLHARSSTHTVHPNTTRVRTRFRCPTNRFSNSPDMNLIMSDVTLANSAQEGILIRLTANNLLNIIDLERL